MRPLKKIIATAMSEVLNPRYRDRRAHYASSAFTCRRDLFWSYTGEPETDKTDFVGKLKMSIGKAVEEVMIGGWVQDAHVNGLHLIGKQVPVGGNAPVKIDGYLDALVYEFENGEKYVLEYKVKFFWGADQFMTNFDPGRIYLGQLGVYLKDLSKKAAITQGCFLFIPITDTHMGKLVQISCRYEAATDEIVAYEAVVSDGTKRDLDYRLRVGEVEAWFASVEKSVKDGVCPLPDYNYKTPLTPEFLAEQSDYQLKAAVAGQKILGDWQPRYSRYFAKQLQVDGTVREYTQEELSKIKGEFNNRLTPTGRKRKQLG